VWRARQHHRRHHRHPHGDKGREQAEPGRSVIATVVGRASAAGVECHPLSLFAAGGPARSGLVLGYGAIATEEGLRRLRSSFNGLSSLS
jgi:hypothetical protein